MTKRTAPIPFSLSVGLLMAACTTGNHLVESGGHSQATAAAEASGPKDGVYLSLAGLASTVSGDFDGTSFVAGGGSAEVMPDLDTGRGWSLALGTRKGAVAFEVGYENSQFDGTFAGVPMDASLSSIDLDLKVHMFSKARVHPHLLFGLAIPWLEVEGGSIGSGNRREDATFSGIGARVGAGLGFYPNPHFGVFVQGGYRLSSFSQVSGIADGELAESVDGSGQFLALGITYIF